MLEGGTIEEFHSDIAAAFVLANFVDGTDVGMVEGGSGAGLTAKAFKGLGVASEIFGKEFEGDEAAEFGVFRFVDDAHAAATEFFENGVAGDFFAS